MRNFRIFGKTLEQIPLKMPEKEKIKEKVEEQEAEQEHPAQYDEINWKAIVLPEKIRRMYTLDEFIQEAEKQFVCVMKRETKRHIGGLFSKSDIEEILLECRLSDAANVQQHTAEILKKKFRPTSFWDNFTHVYRYEFFETTDINGNTKHAFGPSYLPSY